MSYLVTGAYTVAIVCFGISAIFVALFYRKHFASDSLPIEWRSLCAGTASLGVATGLYFIYDITSSSLALQGASLVSLLAGVTLLDATYALWRRFMI